MKYPCLPGLTPDGTVYQNSAMGTVEAMLAAGIDSFIEVGPGKTLCGLIKKTAPQAAVLQVEDADSLAAAVTACKGEGTC